MGGLIWKYTLLIFCLFQVNVFSFHFGGNKRANAAMKMFAGSSYVIVGAAGGVAETIAVSLASSGVKSSELTLVLDKEPLSPVLVQDLKVGKVDVYTGDVDGTLLSIKDGRMRNDGIKSLLGQRCLIAVDDNGFEGVRTSQDRDGAGPSDDVLERLVKSLPQSQSPSGILFAGCINKENVSGVNKLFKKPVCSSLRSFCEDGGKPFAMLRYGELTGGIPGAEPVPIMGPLRKEPKLHPSALLKGVVVTSADNKYAGADLCTREALAAAICHQAVRRDRVEAQVLSIEGQAPTQDDWDKAFGRLAAGSNKEILSIDFREIVRGEALSKWVTDLWFPQALIDSDSAVRLSGARPVRCRASPDGKRIRIQWEDLQEDLTSKLVGELEVVLNTDSTTPSLKVIRLADGVLPGEMQLMDKLVEAVNKNVYKKGLATRVGE